MDADEEKVNMMAYAMGRAVMELALADQSITQQAIIVRLEQVTVPQGYRERDREGSKQGRS